VFSLLANSGMRISELLNLKPEDVTINGVAKIRITGKGNKERVINIPREVMENAINAGLFDRKITARAVEKALKKYAAKAGIKKHVTPHILRHSFGVALAKRNMPINQIQAILGHANLSTTSIYLAIAGNNIEIPQLV